LTLIASLGVFSLENCKKKCPPEEQQYMGTHPLGDIVDYFYFKPGSMWIYECDSTLELDTFVMTSVDTAWSIESYIKYQRISYSRKSLTTGIVINTFQPGGSIPYNSNYSYSYTLITKFNDFVNQRFSQDCVFFKPYDTSIEVTGGTAPTKYKGLLKDFQVLGKTYDSVRVFHVLTTEGWRRPNTWRVNNLNFYTNIKYYHAKNVGLVKYEVFAYDKVRNEPYTHSWNLKVFIPK